MPKATISLLRIFCFSFLFPFDSFSIYISFVLLFCFFLFVLLIFSICLFIYTFIVYLMQHVTSFHINSVNISNNMSDLLWIVHVSRFVFSSRRWWTGHTRTHTVINWIAKQSQNCPHSNWNRYSYSHSRSHSRRVFIVLVSIWYRMFILRFSSSLSQQSFVYFEWHFFVIVGDQLEKKAHVRIHTKLFW